MANELSKYTEHLPEKIGALKKYKVGAMAMYKAHLAKSKAYESIEGSEGEAKKSKTAAGKWEIEAWLCDARIGELLGPGKPGQASSSYKNVEDGSDHHDRYFARRFYDRLVDGSLGKCIEKVETQGPVAYRLPLSVDHFSSDTGEWSTPPEIIQSVIEVFGEIDLDPCSDEKETVPAKKRFKEADDGLAQEWFGKVYMNPPYGSGIDEWVEKLVTSFGAGEVVEAIALVPARTDTEWFRMFQPYPVGFVDGRLKFGGQNNSAPFPSAVIYLGKHVEKCRAAFPKCSWRPPAWER